MEYAENTYMIVSKMAYLIGVDEQYFGEGQNFDSEIFETLNASQSSRIIRNLCLLRTAIHKRFKRIEYEMRYDIKSLIDLPELIPVDAVKQLLDDGINICRSNRLPGDYMIDINRFITERINSCQELFPAWIKWEYIRRLFFSKSSLTHAGNRRANELYHLHYTLYPYQCFINWIPKDYGNLLFSDQKFADILYGINGDIFQDTNNVLDASKKTKSAIHQFLNESETVVLAVDCENSDPYKVYGMLLSLGKEEIGRISKILLFDDVNTTPAWRMLESVINIPISHNLIERVKQRKSLVDTTMTASICQEFYSNHVDSFILCTSDSDYWGVMSVLHDANFLLFVEENQCSPDFQAVMYEKGIPYCFLDEFCMGSNEDLKIRVITEQVKKELEKYSFNIFELLKKVYGDIRVDLTAGEKQQIYDRFIAPIGLNISKDGMVTIQITANKR